jgi:hypothetical protein
MTRSHSCGQAPPTLPLGAVLKTHPREGYWGCAVVLTAGGTVPGFLPLYHIGITPLVFRHDFSPQDLDGRELSILIFDRGVRLAPGTYAVRRETCIGIYALPRQLPLPVIGLTDPTKVFPGPLTYEAGDGTAGKFPLCGPLRPNIGGEAVIAWRAIHDAEAWAAELQAAQESHERLMQQLASDAKQKRLHLKRKSRGA